VQLVAGRAELLVNCVEASRARLSLLVGLASGVISGQGRGYDHDYEANALWLAPVLGAIGRWRLGSGGALSLSTQVFVPHRSQTFSVGRVPGAAFHSAPAAAIVELGAELPLL
jgi:hypothetical protein